MQIYLLFELRSIRTSGKIAMPNSVHFEINGRSSEMNVFLYKRDKTFI